MAGDEMKSAFAWMPLAVVLCGCEHVDRYFHGEAETAASAIERRSQTLAAPTATNAPAPAKRPGERWYPPPPPKDPVPVYLVPRAPIAEE